MKDVFITSHTFGDPPTGGSWYEKGNVKTSFIEPLAKKKGWNEMDAYHVLLTREEWEEIGLLLSDAIDPRVEVAWLEGAKDVVERFFK